MLMHANSWVGRLLTCNRALYSEAGQANFTYLKKYDQWKQKTLFSVSLIHFFCFEEMLEHVDFFLKICKLKQ